MTRYINILLLASFLLQGCSSIKGLFGKKSIGDPNDPDFLNKVQELKSAFRGGNIRALDELIEVYQENNHIPTQREFDDLSNSVYRLKKELRSLRKEMQTLRSSDDE